MKRFLALFLSSLMLLSCVAYGSVDEEEVIRRFKNLENDAEIKEEIEEMYDDTICALSDWKLVLYTSICIAELYNRGLDKNQDYNDISNAISDYVMNYAANKKEEEDQQQPWEKYLEENQSQPQPSQQSSDDYIRPEVKEAIDGYIDYFRSYADFMASYDSSSSLDLAKYFEFLGSYVENMSKFEALDDAGDLTTAEQKYYAEALIEIQKILLDIAY